MVQVLVKVWGHKCQSDLVPGPEDSRQVSKQQLPSIIRATDETASSGVQQQGSGKTS